MKILYRDERIFVHCFQYQLGGVQRNLEQLRAAKLLAGSIDNLATMGYRYNFGLGEDETLLSLTTRPVLEVLKCAKHPAGFIFQHCYAESAVLHYDITETNIASRTRYFPAEVMRALEVDHLPYFCSFATGCTGFIFLVGTAGSLLFSSSEERPIVCVMADCMPPGVPFDMAEERILGSDHSSAFIVGREQSGYRVLAVSYYSTTRMKVALVEIVKRTVEMIQELSSDLDLDLSGSNVAIHYPNIFPDTWRMVTRYLRNPHIQHVVDSMSDRAHCMATDSVISLSKLHRGQTGRIHLVVNYGVGLHLAICVLSEQAADF
jgi:hypothetical protein